MEIYLVKCGEHYLQFQNGYGSSSILEVAAEDASIVKIDKWLLESWLRKPESRTVNAEFANNYLAQSTARNNAGPSRSCLDYLNENARHLKLVKLNVSFEENPIW
jgi:hypothetical protein